MELGNALKNDLIDLYRFSVLLTGSEDKARQVITEALSDPGNELPQLRSARHRKAWLVTRIRKIAHAIPTEAANPGESQTWASCFCRLDEPERSALALFYLDFLSIRDMAQVLKMSVEDLAAALGEARLHLREIAEGVARS